MYELFKCLEVNFELSFYIVEVIINEILDMLFIYLLDVYLRFIFYMVVEEVYLKIMEKF